MWNEESQEIVEKSDGARECVKKESASERNKIIHKLLVVRKFRSPPLPHPTIISLIGRAQTNWCSVDRNENTNNRLTLSISHTLSPCLTRNRARRARPQWDQLLMRADTVKISCRSRNSSYRTHIFLRACLSADELGTSSSCGLRRLLLEDFGQAEHGRYGRSGSIDCWLR